MTTTTASGLVRILAAAALTIAAFAGVGSAASAGGWAVASLDSTPAAEPGASTAVSFTILQHGVTPADLDEGVGIEIRDHDGGSAYFPAVGDGTGHYVATVTFPEAAGSYDWLVQMGWFGPYELGTLDVRATPAASPGVWSVFRLLTLGGVLLLAGFAVADRTLVRRRHLATR